MQDFTKAFRSVVEEQKRRYFKTCEERGLLDRRRVPKPTKCVGCESLVPPRWEEQPFGHWVSPGDGARCQVCRNETLATADREKHQSAIERATIPIRLRGLRLDQLDQDRTNEKLAQACLGWDGRSWIIASGGVGTGKTSWLTATMIEHLRRRSGSSMWTTEQRFYRMAQIRGEKSRTGREQLVQRAIDADILMVDDLGAGRRDLTEWQGGAMRELLMERHLEGKPTLITTNLSERALGEAYGEHVASRMNEAGGVLNLGGADRRRRTTSSWLRFWGR